MRATIFDIEGDGLHPTKIHVVSFRTFENGKPGQKYSTNDYDEMRKVFLESEVLVGHNIVRWDIIHLERLLGIKISQKVLIIDTLALSWYLYPERGVHNLESWGDFFGVQKPEIEDWDNLTYEEYAHRCEEDVEITTLLFQKFQNDLIELYGNDKDNILKLLKYLKFKLDCLRIAEENKWKVDIQRIDELLAEYEKIRLEKEEILKAVMPKVPILKTRNPPKRPMNKDGSFSAVGKRWLDLTKQKGLPFDHNEPIVIEDGYNEPNPGSNSQLKDWLFSIGWEPRTFKDSKSVTGDVKQIPQINLPFGKGVCSSVLELKDRHPEVLELDNYSVLKHRIPQLGTLKEDAIERGGFCVANASAFTNTLRLRHAELVNLPKPEKSFAGIRSTLVSRPGFCLLGSDLKSLEDRIKQHFIWPKDPDYVRTMMDDNFDPHLTLALSAKAVSLNQVSQYNQGKDPDDQVHKIRSIYKNGNYALQYGAGIPRLMRTTGATRGTCALMHKAYHELNWSLKAIAEEQVVKNTQDGKMWLLNPISGIYYSLREEKDIISTLIQGTASFVFDLWLGFVVNAELGRKGVNRSRLVGQFHDEFILEIPEEEKEDYTTVLEWAIEQTNDILNLNRELDIDIQFGKRYSEVH